MKTAITTYGDCGTCQTRTEGRGNSIGGVEGIYCIACGRTILENIVKVTAKFVRDAQVCGPRCLSGRRSCECKCNGRCHGANRCYCGKAA